MKTLKKIVGEVMHISPNKVDGRTSPKNVKHWDSLRGLLLITAIENNYKIKLTTQDILSIKNVGDIKKILLKRRVKIEK